MLKKYISMKEMARDIRTIKRQTKPLAENISDRFSIMAAIKSIDIRGDKVDTPSNTRSKFSATKSKEITQKTSELDKLLHHQREIGNIINSIINEFTDEEYPDKDKLLVTAKRLAANIDDKIKKLKGSLSVDSQKTLPDLLAKVANILKRNLDKELTKISKSNKTTTLTGIVKNEPQHTLYFNYNEVESDSGEVTPLVVIALSSYDGKLYVNPSLHDILIPGKFKLGFELSGNSASAIAAAALKEINTQLLADSMLSSVAGVPVPFTKSKLRYLKFDNNVKIKFSPEGDALIIIIDTSNTDGGNIARKQLSADEVQEIANNLVGHFNSLILADKNLPKLSIKYTKKPLAPKGYGWQIVFKFLPAGKYTGKTLDQQDIDHLRQRFTDEEIHTILVSLQK